MSLRLSLSLRHTARELDRACANAELWNRLPEASTEVHATKGKMAVAGFYLVKLADSMIAGGEGPAIAKLKGLAEGIAAGAAVRCRAYPFETRQALADYLDEAALVCVEQAGVEELRGLIHETQTYVTLYDEVSSKELDCEECSGNGTITRYEEGGRLSHEEECPACGGFGRREDI